jgi:DNA-binding PadR family transcriptional regulator
MQVIQAIQNRIYALRGERVMLDFDLAALYEVETKVFNQTVKRNNKRFPEDFMFQLTTDEWKNISSSIMMRFTQNIKSETTNRSQFVTSSQKHRSTLPYAFTEQGVAMLSGILNSDKAINMNIAIMRAFVEIRKIVLQTSGLKEQLKEIKERLSEHDVQLNQIYDALENLLDENIAKRKWDERERIGFKK